LTTADAERVERAFQARLTNIATETVMADPCRRKMIPGLPVRIEAKSGGDPLL